MTWRKAPDSLVSTFDAALPRESRVERRKMFGYPCAFVNGNMFTGLFQDSMMLRLPEKERASFLELPGAGRFEPRPGRIMKEYVVVPGELLTEGSKLRRWVMRSFEYASSLPAKRKATASGARPAARRATR